MGHSNGGRFSYVLWAARGETFAAFGISGSPATGLLYRLSPKPAFLIAGEKDPLVPFAGQKMSMDSLIGLDRCGKEGRRRGPLTSYASADGNDLQTYIHPGGHEYPREANALMVEFFQKHPKGTGALARD